MIFINTFPGLASVDICTLKTVVTILAYWGSFIVSSFFGGLAIRVRIAAIRS